VLWQALAWQALLRHWQAAFEPHVMLWYCCHPCLSCEAPPLVWKVPQRPIAACLHTL